jgi:hypothetical protein
MSDSPKKVTLTVPLNKSGSATIPVQVAAGATGPDVHAATVDALAKSKASIIAAYGSLAYSDFKGSLRDTLPGETAKDRRSDLTNKIASMSLA